MKTNYSMMTGNKYRSNLHKNKSHWVKMPYLKYDVIGQNGQVLLPAGTPNVSIAFRCGCFTYVNDYGQVVRANKYRDAEGRIYYGH